LSASYFPCYCSYWRNGYTGCSLLVYR
ncbi:Na(+)/H(+) antiporter NhaA, partial [Haemophilus influenzae]